MKQKLKINLRGRFLVLAPDGSDRTPSSKKGRALLALLTLSPGNVRSRVWLQEKLWSQQEPSSRAASLRQCLSILRKALDPYQDLLIIDKQSISLNAETDSSQVGELLEDLNINDPEFKYWLADQSLLDAGTNQPHESVVQV